MPEVALHVPERGKKDYEKRLKIAEADGRTDILIPVDCRRVVSRVATAGDLPLVVVPRQVAWLNLLRFQIFTDAKLRTVAVDEPRLALFELPCSDKCLFVGFARKVGNLQRYKHLVRIRDIDA